VNRAALFHGGQALRGAAFAAGVASEPRSRSLAEPERRQISSLGPRRQAASDRVRIAVIGAGLAGQAVHIPTLQRLADRFSLVGVADPSETVRAGLAARHPGLRTHADWRSLLEKERLDAILVCSPLCTHAQIALAALDAGVHVFVENPLAITLEDVDAISRRRADRDLVVQAGYIKRFDAGFELLIAALPASAAGLRLIDIVTYDPGLARPPVAPRGVIAGTDLSAADRAELARAEREQVKAVIGTDDPGLVYEFSQVYLRSLIHEVNLVHGVLEHLAVDIPAPAATSAHSAEGKAAHAFFALANGVLCRCARLELEAVEEHRETASVYFADSVLLLRLDAPRTGQRLTSFEVRRGEQDEEPLTQICRVRDANAAQLRHFHDCITGRAACRTPPEQARTDILALRDAFLAQSPPERR
jgi:predicted dehydrogenase